MYIDVLIKERVMPACIHCFVSGRVQGVWFRAHTQKQAQQLDLKGWVRNLDDGRVEVFACGDEEPLERFHLWLQQGPELAIVEACSREPADWQEFSGFVIR